MENKIELKSIKNLLGRSYYIPMYQRGYRWSEQQIIDLLTDIKEFMGKENKAQGEFYCLQPIVVKQNIENAEEFKKEIQQIKDDVVVETQALLNKYAHWEVIDGQQRLTTIKIILSYIGSSSFDISYQTRESSHDYMNAILQGKIVDNIDFYHMEQAYKTVKSWFESEEKRNEAIKAEWEYALLNNVKVIWYETTEPDSIKVFTRLNIGKIALTNAELIKALLLNKSNFSGSDKRIRLQQQEIASQWDSIEYQLQDDEFWLFLNTQEEDIDKRRPTRIDFLFDVICQKDILGCGNDHLGRDAYVTYRYFDRYFKLKGEDTFDNLTTIWGAIRRLYLTFKEWYNDIELYHYIGYLITCKDATNDTSQARVNKIYDLSKNKTKSTFKECLKNEICAKFRHTTIDKIKYSDSNLTDCRNILLLYNIETTVMQCIQQKNSKYKLPVFCKFPFHLYKRENWDVEHIASQTENPLDKVNDQKEWLKSAYLSPTVNEELKTKIASFINGKDTNEFLELKEEILATLPSNYPIIEKDSIGNLALLDSKTNRGYKNAIFPTKRRWIIDKDQGKRTTVHIENNEVVSLQEDGLVAFIPICTRNVFLKYYSPLVNDVLEWNKKDADAYVANMRDVLNGFIK